MKKYWIAATTGALAGVLVTTQFAAPLVAQNINETRSTYEQLDLFGDIFERIRAAYVEEVDDEALIRAAINGMLTSLDPHSSYMSPDAYSELQFDTRGEFGGLGVEVTQEEGWIKVISPMDGTPADEAGIMAGDFITHVNGEPTLGLTMDEAVEMMRGPVGSEITLTIVRDLSAEPFDVSLVRDTIKLTAVRVRTEGHTIVARVTTFSEQTFENLEQGILAEIEAAGGIENIQGVVLDLRNNPGGLLNQAVAVSDAFLEQGEIVSTRGRDDRNANRYDAQPGDLAQGLPIVVLINGGSASASEIVAGALQDHHRAVVVGTQSFGKGSVQTIMPLGSEGAIRLTTQRYYTPSGRSIQALGVAPDILVEQRPPVAADEEGEATAALRRRSEGDLRGALAGDSLSEEERAARDAQSAEMEAAARLRDRDYQLAYALDIITGLSVLSAQ